MRIKILLTLIVIGIYIYYESDIYPYKYLDITKFQTGDIILVSGKTIRGTIVKIFEGKLNSFSHCGLLVNQNDSVYILDIIPQDKNYDKNQHTDIKKQEIHAFLSDQSIDDWVILRHKSMSIEKQKNIIFNSVEMLNSNIIFDHNFDIHTKDKMYCTELIYHIFNNINLHLIRERYDSIIYPSMLMESSFLGEVYSKTDYIKALK
jgi:hypothetical protein